MAELSQNEHTMGVAVKAGSNVLFPIIEAGARALFAQK